MARIVRNYSLQERIYCFMSYRFIQMVTPDCLAHDSVPPLLAELLGHLSCNEIVCSLVPQLRDNSVTAVKAHRPQIFDILENSIEMEKAAAAGQLLINKVRRKCCILLFGIHCWRCLDLQSGITRIPFAEKQEILQCRGSFQLFGGVVSLLSFPLRNVQ